MKKLLENPNNIHASLKLPDYLLQQGLSVSGEGVVMMVARLLLALVFVVVAIWSTGMDVFFILFLVFFVLPRCWMNGSEVFSGKTKNG